MLNVEKGEKEGGKRPLREEERGKHRVDVGDDMDQGGRKKRGMGEEKGHGMGGLEKEKGNRKQVREGESQREGQGRGALQWTECLWRSEGGERMGIVGLVGGSGVGGVEGQGVGDGVSVVGAIGGSVVGVDAGIVEYI